MGKRPFHFQSAVHDCVPTCVLALAEYYCVPVTLKKLRQLLITDPMQGTPLKNLLYLKELFQVEIGKLTEIEQIGIYFPFIAYLKHGHAVVVWGYANDGVTLLIGDPGVGIMPVALEDFFEQWDGLTVVLRPLEDQKNFDFEGSQKRAKENRFLPKLLETFTFLEIPWSTMVWVSLITGLVGGLNAFYSLHYVQYLNEFMTFIVFALCYTALSGVLNWLSNLVQARLVLKYSHLIGWKIRDALPRIDRKFYTIGDISVRYQDVSIVISTIMGIFRDIPYTLIIFGTSLYFLFQVSWLLSLFAVCFLLLLVSILMPFVKRIQNADYAIRNKESELMNRLRGYLTGENVDVNASWEEALQKQYSQSLWSIPISTTVGNSAVFPVLFVVLFLHWKTGGNAKYQDLLTALMVMNYAVSAGHTLYSRYVSWQTAQPSFHRLKDFLEIDQELVADAVADVRTLQTLSKK